MRVLVTTQPGSGHLNPLVPLAWALRDAGHEVKVACSASFVRRVDDPTSTIRHPTSNIQYPTSRHADPCRCG